MTVKSVIGRLFLKSVFRSDENVKAALPEAADEPSHPRRVSTMPKPNLLSACERIQRIFEPHLGFEMARERAANLTQALQYIDDAPLGVIREMLSQTELKDNEAVVARVFNAWRAFRECDDEIALTAMRCTYTDFPPSREPCCCTKVA
jgi:hypothetical protein